jgi:hypothetical protein
MQKLSYRITPIALALATLFWNASAHAQNTSTDPDVRAVQSQRPLSRRDVYNQLVQAQKDGSLARTNSIYYGTYWGWEDPTARQGVAARN